MFNGLDFLKVFNQILKFVIEFQLIFYPQFTSKCIRVNTPKMLG